MKVHRFSLTLSILAFLSCLLLLTWLLFSIMAYKTSANDLYEQKIEHARILLSTFVQQLPEKIPTLESGILETTSPASIYANNLSNDKDFLRLTLLDNNGKPVFTVGQEGVGPYKPFVANPSPKNGCTIINTEVYCVSGVIGDENKLVKAGALFSLSNENSRLNRSRTLFMSYFAIDFIMLLGLGSFILSRMVVSPLTRLISATERITSGHYGQKIQISGSSELAQLAEAFNKMSSTLNQKEEQVHKHLKALQQANNELQLAREETIRTEKMASIGLLAAGMAHEIGSPLASITGYSELIETEELDTETTKEYANRIALDCSRIDRIVRGLLDYAKPTGTAVQSCYIPELLQETIKLLTAQGALKNITVNTTFDPKLQYAAVDPGQLQQVLLNLIINARDAMPDGGTISIETKGVIIEDSLFLQLNISDTGQGIDQKNIKHIFDPFFTTKEPGKGTGLGLAISARIIEGFGGSINLRTEGSKGTTFSLALPGVQNETESYKR